MPAIPVLMATLSSDAQGTSPDPVRLGGLGGLDRESPRHADDQLQARKEHLAVLDPALLLGEGEGIEQGAAALEANADLAMILGFAGLAEPSGGLG